MLYANHISRCEQNKKPKLENTNGTFSKKKNVVESDDEDEDMNVSTGSAG